MIFVGTPQRLRKIIVFGTLISGLSTLFAIHHQSVRDRGILRSVIEYAQALAYSDSCTVCLFTTFKPATNKLKIYKSTLLNHAALSSTGRVHSIVFDTFLNESKRPAVMETLLAIARQLGSHVYEAPRVTKGGVPYFREMYLEAARQIPNCAFYGFTNGDILFTDGLVRTLEAVDQSELATNQILVVGRRTNLDIRHLSNSSSHLPIEVDCIGRSRGQLFRTNAEDYFFIRRNEFPWHVIPDLAVGRPGYDNFVVAMALRNNVSVVDATDTLRAVHQTDAEGNFAGHRNIAERWMNFRMMKSFKRGTGLTSDCHYMTRTVQDNSTLLRTVAIFRRLRRGRTVKI